MLVKFRGLAKYVLKYVRHVNENSNKYRCFILVIFYVIR